MAGSGRRSGTSIQGLLEDLLGRLEGTRVSVVGAGRTDAGVHALGQVASVRLDRCRLSGIDLQRALNATLPATVRVLRVDEVAADFHARHAARAKRYDYRVVDGPMLLPFDAGYAWHVAEPLDVTAMRTALETVIGRHDFAAFQSAGGAVITTTRTMFEAWIDEIRYEAPGFRLQAPGSGLQASGLGLTAHARPDSALQATHELGPEGRLLTVTLRGDGFLRHMVRSLVGTLVAIGHGRLEPGRVAALLAAPDRARTGPTAPPHGLFLVSVEYTDSSRT